MNYSKESKEEALKLSDEICVKYFIRFWGGWQLCFYYNTSERTYF